MTSNRHPYYQIRLKAIPKRTGVRNFKPKLKIINSKPTLHYTSQNRRRSIPALIPEAPAFFKPFFLTMKLPPMKKLEESASTRPFTLSEDIPSCQLGGSAAIGRK